MKTIGEQAKEFRESRAWSVKQMADACGTSRQNIETLEAKGARTPRYIKDLAGVMGTTVDVLMEGRYRVDSAPVAAASPASSRVSEPKSDALLQALNVLASAISNADELTRLSIEPLLSRLAQRPQESGTISQKLYEELRDRTEAGPKPETERDGQLFDVDMGKQEQGDKRISTATKGRKAS